jgi:hypothetical protein
MQGEGEEAYSMQSVTEPSTPQMAALRSNPLGSGSFAASRCRCVGHNALSHCFLLAPRPAANLFAAIGALD